MGPIDYARPIASSDGIRAVAIHGNDRSCVLVIPMGSEAKLELSAAEIEDGDWGRLHWLDLATGRKLKVQLKQSAANPQQVTISPNPNLEAPGVLTID
jgi:hypothetical protein